MTLIPDGTSARPVDLMVNELALVLDHVPERTI
jgi:hypothetical protein